MQKENNTHIKLSTVFKYWNVFSKRLSGVDKFDKVKTLKFTIDSYSDIEKVTRQLVENIEWFKFCLNYTNEDFQTVVSSCKTNPDGIIHQILTANRNEVVNGILVNADQPKFKWFKNQVNEINPEYHCLLKFAPMFSKDGSDNISIHVGNVMNLTSTATSLDKSNNWYCQLLVPSGDYKSLKDQNDIIAAATDETDPINTLNVKMHPMYTNLSRFYPFDDIEFVKNNFERNIVQIFFAPDNKAREIWRSNYIQKHGLTFTEMLCL